MGTLGKHREQTITLVYITVRHKPYRVIVTVPVWRCTKCRSIRREPIPFRFGNTRLTQQVFDDFKAEFTELHHKGSMHEIALHYHISDQRVAQLLDYINYHSKDAFAIALPIERRRSNITQITECNFLPPDFPINVMLIDEVALRRRDFITIVINPLTRQLLFYAPGRGADAIYKLNEWSNGQIAPDAIVATDMSAVFMATLRKFIPGATFVNDRFHHMRNARKHLNWEVKTVVSLLKAQGRVDDAAFLSDHETIEVLFTTDLDKLNPELKERYDKAIALHERLQLIRDCYIELYMGFESKTIEEARAHMLQARSSSKQPCLTTLLRTGSSLSQHQILELRHRCRFATLSTTKQAQTSNPVTIVPQQGWAIPLLSTWMNCLITCRPVLPLGPLRALITCLRCLSALALGSSV